MSGSFLPYFRVFPAESLADERFSLWTCEERGAFFTLLMHAWVNGSIPSDHGELARILRLRKDSFARVWKAIGCRFVTTQTPLGVRLTNTRLEVERESALAKSDAARKSAEAKWAQVQAQAHQY